ncbi:hypothetical protein ABZ297_42760 [Nonomuraea sp. NPDC005983]|uniref:hypothetical protein n=1 Tax=Nonomuraea sp. NPDC005983 TaxID=3155595 RepID=UPI0033BA44A6
MDLQPAPRRRATRRGYALAVLVAGAVLAICAVLPWAGIQASSDLIGGGVTRSLRGTDDRFGIYTLVAGLAAAALGLAGTLSRPRLAALAMIPGALAAVVLVMFISDPKDVGDRISIDLGGLLSIEPVIQYGWWAALASSLAVVVLAVLALVGRR